MLLSDFVRESNRIERILREPTPAEIKAHETFLERGPSLTNLIEFVAAVQPDARLRDRPGLDVRVGTFIPPAGGLEIETTLVRILETARDPYWTHHLYETLHPFTDGNGRSGRALWLWMMGGIEKVPLGFLHHWYYQTLAAGSAQILTSEGDFKSASIAITSPPPK